MNPIEFPVGLPVQTGKRLRHTKVQGKWFSQTISYKKTIVAENCSKIVILHFARFLKSLLIGDYNVFIFGEVFGQINMTTYLVKDSPLFRTFDWTTVYYQTQKFRRDIDFENLWNRRDFQVDVILKWKGIFEIEGILIFFSLNS